MKQKMQLKSLDSNINENGINEKCNTHNWHSNYLRKNEISGNLIRQRATQQQQHQQHQQSQTEKKSSKDEC